MTSILQEIYEDGGLLHPVKCCSDDEYLLWKNTDMSIVIEHCLSGCVLVYSVSFLYFLC